jgi:hypothetical protein
MLELEIVCAAVLLVNKRTRRISRIGMIVDAPVNVIHSH